MWYFNVDNQLNTHFLPEDTWTWSVGFLCWSVFLPPLLSLKMVRSVWFFFFNTDIVSAFSVLLIATSFSSKKLRKEHLKNILNKNASFKVIRKGQVENELVSEDNVSNLFLSVSSQVPDRSRNKRILNFVHFRKSPFI